MKLTAILDAFTGNRQERARQELDKRANELARNPDASLDDASLASISDLMERAGRDADYLRQTIEIARRRNSARADLAGADERLRDLQATKDRDQTNFDKIEKEYFSARGKAFESATAHTAEIRRLGELRAFLHESAPQHLKDALDVARNAGNSLQLANRTRFLLARAKRAKLFGSNGAPMQPAEKHAECLKYIAQLEADLADYESKAPGEQKAIQDAEAAILAA